MDAMTLKAVLTLDSSAYDKGLSAAKGAASTLGSAFSTGLKVAGAAVAAATTAVAGFAKSSVDAGMSFDQSMSQVAATMGDKADKMVEYNGKTISSMEALRDFAQEMGRTTAFSATESADALNYMALAGYDAETSMNMLPSVLNLAAAGSMDLARASDMVTDTQTAFGISLERTSQMVDEMAKAASTGNTSVEQLGDAFLTVGGLAQELNGGVVKLADGTTQSVDGVQELEIALTAMANAGIKGSEAGTHMRNMLLKLSSPTDAGVKQLAALGVSVFDAGGKMRSLKDIMGDLNGAMNNLTQEDKLKAISDLFNTRDTASAEALLKAVGQDWDYIGGEILNAQGAAEKMAKTQLDNLAGDITLFKSALEGAKIAVSDELTPSLREFVQFGTDGLSRITGAFKEGGLTGAMEEFGTILSEGLNMIISKTPEFINAGLELLGALGKGFTDNIDVIMDAVIKVIGQLGDAFVKNFPKLVDVGLQIIETLMQSFDDNFDAIMEGGASLIEGIVEAIGKHVDGLEDSAMSIIEKLTQFLIQNIPDISEFITKMLLTFVEWVTQNAGSIIETAVTIISTLAEGLVSALPDLIPATVEMILSIVEGLLDNLDQLIDTALEIIMALAEGLIDALPKLIEKAPVIIEKLVMAIVNNLPKIIEVAVKIIITLAETLIQNLPKIISAANDIIVALVKGIGQYLSKAAEAARNIMDTIKNAIKNFDVVQWGKDMIDSFIDGIKKRIGAVKDAVGDVASAVKEVLGFSEPEEGPLSNFHTFAPDMMDLFIKGVKDNTKKLQDQIKTSFDFGGLIMDTENVEMGSGRMGGSSTTDNRSFTINVYGTEGQDINALAEAVNEKLAHLLDMEEAVYA